MPFKYIGANADLSAFAEGLCEDIVTGLSRFSYLRVIARNSTLRLAKGSSDVRAIGKELGARYVMEGSLRQAGTRLRLAVQLIDAKTGAHLWAENYERSFSPETIFELQDELVPRIVSTVADQYGALVHSMSESLRGRSTGEYSAHEAVLRAFGYQERFTLEEHAEVRDDPRSGDCSRPQPQRLPRRTVVRLLARVRVRLQPQARSTRPRPCCRATSGRICANVATSPIPHWLASCSSRKISRLSAPQRSAPSP